MKELETPLSIAAVEREVGLSKDVLRVWERRYGFPVPLRDRNDERLYPPEQVHRLRSIKRLMDQGHRPGRLLPMPPEELESLAAPQVPPPRRAGAGPGTAAVPEDLLACLRSHDASGLVRLFQQQLARAGLEKFVLDIAAPMAVQVGEQWAQGALQVYEEHLFTETCARVLRQAIAAVPPGRAPVVLLTTAPEESHGLGLLMVESMLTLHGARCINLGTQMPLAEIARAAQVYGAHVVALSFSSAFPARQLPQVLGQLRATLPAGVQLWAGGAAVRRLRPMQQVHLLAGLDDAVAAVQAWQAQH